MKSIFQISLFLTLFFLSCRQEVESTTSPLPSSALNEEKTQLLLFKKEEKWEIWKNGHPITTPPVTTSESTNYKNLPLGVFQIKTIKNNIFTFHFPNKFYQEKLQINSANTSLFWENTISIPKAGQHLSEGLQEVFIFPNDIRSGGQFVPCFACPHWITEQYSYLEYQIRQFQKTAE